MKLYKGILYILIGFGIEGIECLLLLIFLRENFIEIFLKKGNKKWDYRVNILLF